MPLNCKFNSDSKGAICDSSGKMNFYEKFFCGAKPKYMIVNQKNLQETDRYPHKPGFLFTLLKIICYITVLPALYFHYKKIQYREKMQFIVLGVNKTEKEVEISPPYRTIEQAVERRIASAKKSGVPEPTELQRSEMKEIIKKQKFDKIQSKYTLLQPEIIVFSPEIQNKAKQKILAFCKSLSGKYSLVELYEEKTKTSLKNLLESMDDNACRGVAKTMLKYPNKTSEERQAMFQDPEILEEIAFEQAMHQICSKIHAKIPKQSADYAKIQPFLINYDEKKTVLIKEDSVEVGEKKIKKFCSEFPSSKKFCLFFPEITGDFHHIFYVRKEGTTFQCVDPGVGITRKLEMKDFFDLIKRYLLLDNYKGCALVNS